MSIIDCSNDVSLRSACVVNVFFTLGPDTVEWSVANNAEPSPDLNVAVEGRPLIKGSTAFTCLALLIDLAKAFVYLAESLS